VEQLGGTIAVESEVGRGTSFTLRFPARDDLSTQAAAS
jgi:signal transduction histidine kinase